jgi:hypothetical protein
MRRKRTIKEAEAVKVALAEIIKDVFDSDGQVITHDELADAHVKRNLSRSADEDVALYGGVAAAMLRRDEGYAIVPVTAQIANWTGAPASEEEVANTVAGLGAGGPRIGWYHPASKDDWLWVFYIGHLIKSGVSSVFHGTEQMRRNPTLTSAKAQGQIAKKAAESLPAPASAVEKKVLAATNDR